MLFAVTPTELQKQYRKLCQSRKDVDAAKAILVKYDAIPLEDRCGFMQAVMARDVARATIIADDKNLVLLPYYLIATG